MLARVELNISQAAAYLNCSVDTIRRRIRSGQLQARLDDRGRYMISFNGGEPAARGQVQPPPVTSEVMKPEPEAGQGNIEVVGDEWFDTWPEHRPKHGSATVSAEPDLPEVPTIEERT